MNYKNTPELPEACLCWEGKRLIDRIRDFESQGINSSEIAIRGDFHATKANITGEVLLCCVINTATREMVYVVRVRK